MTGFDEGLLAPVAVGQDRVVGDEAVLAALVAAETALVGAYADIGMLPAESLSTIEAAFAQVGAEIDVAALAADAVAAGNPIIPLVARLKHPLADDLRLWVHRGVTSQDIVDTALMIVAREAVALVRRGLADADDALALIAQEHGSEVVAARTLTQHAVPTTVGARISLWRRGLARASARLSGLEFPAQLSGAAGTGASFVEITGSADDARALAAAFAQRAGLLAIDGSWQVARWPVTELGDALVQAIDALGKLAADIATLGRTEIGELSEGAGGGSSAMPQKQNPVASTLIRSAALRAPQLGATLHLASASAVDERPDGAWHAEWPTLRELLRLALGASAQGASLAAGLRVDRAAGARNLALSGGLIVSERLAIVLVPLIGRARFDALIAEVSGGGDLRESLLSLPEDIDVDDLLDPARYTGLAPFQKWVPEPVEGPGQGRFGKLSDPFTKEPVEGAGRFDELSDPVAEARVDLKLVDVAEGPAGAPVVVLGPSLGTSTILWEQVAPALAATHRVIAWDLPGHGAAAPTTHPFTVADLADQLAATLHEQGIDSIRYAGVSLGGAVGLELLLRHPSLVERSAILCSGAVIGDPEGWRARAAQVRTQSTSSLIIGSAQRWFAPDSIAAHPDLTGRLLHVLQNADDESYALCCEALAGYDVRPRLGEIAAPVLAIWGDHDQVTPEASAREIADGVRDGRAAGIADASHLAPVDDPAAVSALLTGFFSEHRTEGTRP